MRMIEGTRAIPSELTQVRTLVADVMAVLEAAGLGESESYDVKTALMEALTNAVKCQTEAGQPAGSIWYRLEREQLRIRVIDRGQGFDWESCPDPTHPESLLREGGRGVYLINRLMDRADYDRESRTLTMEKRLSRPSKPE